MAKKNKPYFFFSKKLGTKTYTEKYTEINDAGKKNIILKKAPR